MIWRIGEWGGGLRCLMIRQKKIVAYLSMEIGSNQKSERKCVISSLLRYLLVLEDLVLVDAVVGKWKQEGRY